MRRFGIGIKIYERKHKDRTEEKVRRKEKMSLKLQMKIKDLKHLIKLMDLNGQWELNCDLEFKVEL